MRYLFFDIECANCFDGTGKICEFGYCVTDENFRVKKEKNILINPKSSFDPYVVKKILHSEKEEYLSSPDFKSFYPHIEALLSEKDQIVVGHTIDSDAKYIFDECVRYGVKPPEFSYLDIREVYRKIINSQTSVSLGKMGEQLGVTYSGLLHTAVTDANLTMLVTEAICKNEKVTLSDLVKSFPEAVGSIDLIQRHYREKHLMAKYLKSCKDMGFEFMTGENAEIFNKYKKLVKPKRGKLIDAIRGKTFCISKNFEYVHFKEMLELSQLIINAGGIPISSATKCDVFIKYDVEIEDKELLACKRYESVKKRIKDGNMVEITELSDFLKLFHLEEKDLSLCKNVNFKLIERIKLGIKKSGKNDKPIEELIDGKIRKLSGEKND